MIAVPWRVRIQRRDGSVWEKTYPDRKAAEQVYFAAVEANWTRSGSLTPEPELAR